jgi:hypothetical protein
LFGQPAAVMDEEAARAGELICLLGQHSNDQLLAGQVGTGQFEVLRGLRLVDVNRTRLGLVPSRLELV